MKLYAMPLHFTSLSTSLNSNTLLSVLGSWTLAYRSRRSKLSALVPFQNELGFLTYCLKNITRMCVPLPQLSIIDINQNKSSTRVLYRLVNKLHFHEDQSLLCLGPRGVVLVGVVGHPLCAAELLSASFIFRCRTAREMSPWSPHMKVQMKHRWKSHLKSQSEE